MLTRTPQQGALPPPEAEGEWRSERAQELDRVGGPHRPPVRRSHTMEFKLQCLRHQLQEQGHKAEDMLAKDPNAGRYEMQLQAVRRAAKDGVRLRHKGLSVRAWQNARHFDLWAGNQKRRRGTSRTQRHQQQPEDPTGSEGQQQAAAAAAAGDEEEWVEVEAGGRPGSGRAWQSAWWAPATGGEQQDRRAVRQRMLNYGNRFRIHGPGRRHRPSSSAARRPGSVTSPSKAPPLTGWRQNIADAKRRVRLQLGCLALLQHGSLYAKRRMLNRMSSMNLVLATALGGEAGKFAEQQGVYRRIKGQVMALKKEQGELQAKQLVEETHGGLITAFQPPAPATGLARTASTGTTGLARTGSTGGTMTSGFGLAPGRCNSPDLLAPVSKGVGVSSGGAEAGGAGSGGATSSSNARRVSSSWDGPLTRPPTAAVGSAARSSTGGIMAGHSSSGSTSGGSVINPLRRASVDHAASNGSNTTAESALRPLTAAGRRGFADMAALAESLGMGVGGPRRASVSDPTIAPAPAAAPAPVAPTAGSGGAGVPPRTAAGARRATVDVLPGFRPTTAAPGEGGAGGNSSSGNRVALPSLGRPASSNGRAPSPLPGARRASVSDSVTGLSPGVSPGVSPGRVPVPPPPAAAAAAAAAAARVRAYRASQDGGSSSSTASPSVPAGTTVPAARRVSLTSSSTPGAANTSSSTAGQLVAPATAAGAGAGGRASPLPPTGNSAMKKRVGGTKRRTTAELAAEQAALEASRLAALQQEIKQQETSLSKPASMLGVYANRSNGRWAEGRSWALPQLYDPARLAQQLGGAQAAVFRDQVLRLIRSGGLAVQLLALDMLEIPAPPYNPQQQQQGPNSSSSAPGAEAPVPQQQSMFTADPAQLLAALSPLRLALLPDLTRGMCLGVRAIAQLLASIEALAGIEAARKLQVVLHVPADQELPLLQVLGQYGLAGLAPEQLLLLVQPRGPGYVWDEGLRRFMKVPSSRQELIGSGYCLMQLAWAGEAWTLAPATPRTPSSSSAAAGGNGAAGAGASSSGSSGPAGASAAAGGGEGSVLEKVEVEGSAMAELARRGVKWMLSADVRDLSLYQPTSTSTSAGSSGAGPSSGTGSASGAAGAAGGSTSSSGGVGCSGLLDLDWLAYCLYLAEQGGVNMSCQVLQKDSMSAVRQYGSVVLGTGIPHNTSSAASPAAAAAAGAAGAAPATTAKSQYCHILPYNSFQTPVLTQQLQTLSAASNGKVTASLTRYAFHVPSLQRVLGAEGVFRPQLSVQQELAYVKFEFADVTSAPGARCVAMLGRGSAQVLTAVESQAVEALAAYAQEQDRNHHFKRVIGRATKHSSSGPHHHSSHHNHHRQKPAAAAADPAAAAAQLAGLLQCKPAAGGRTIVVLVADNAATRSAVDLALTIATRPVDTLRLVTVVTGALAASGGRTLLTSVAGAASTTLCHVVCEVLTRDSNRALVDVVEDYLDTHPPDLVLVGSQALASVAPGVSGAAVGVMPVGSVALSLLRQLQVPLCVVKANAKLATIQWGTDKLRVAVGVDHGARGLLKHVTERLLVPTRGDRLVLVRVNPPATRGQDPTTVSQRLLDSFEDAASLSRCSATKRLVEPGASSSSAAAYCQAAEVDKCHILAVQAPPGKGLPEHLLQLVMGARCGVLISRTKAEGSAGL